MKLRHFILIFLVGAFTTACGGDDPITEPVVVNPQPKPGDTGNTDDPKGPNDPDTPDTPDEPDDPSGPTLPEIPADTKQRSPNTRLLYDYLVSIYGQKTLSGTMACVNWNTNEAQWVHKHTGRWPAINCFDFIHLPFTQAGGWIDYSNISVVEDWHNQGGIVAAMWHWNVPANDGAGFSFNYGSEADRTSFDVRKIFDENSEEYARMIKDIDQVAGYLKLLRAKDIPVIWRPLHEAGGKWFWWGMDADACKQLWKVMYERFEAAGLDNLIWAFTPAAQWQRPFSEGFDWYPGDEYVDIVGFDIYNVSNGLTIYKDYFTCLLEQCPQKLIALTEMGNVANMSVQWKAGSRWLFFMPWYDNGRTGNPTSSEFSQTSHNNANINWWKDAWSKDYVLSRDQVKYK